MKKHLKNGNDTSKREQTTHELPAIAAATGKKPRGNVIGNVERLAYAARARNAAEGAKSPRGGSAAPKPKRSAPTKTAGKRATHLSLKKIEEIGAMVLDPERLLAAIDHAEHAEHEDKSAEASSGASAAPKAMPVLLGDVGEPASESSDADASGPQPILSGDRVTPVPPSGARPADDGTPKPPPLRENERAVATHTGVIIIRRWRAA